MSPTDLRLLVRTYLSMGPIAYRPIAEGCEENPCVSNFQGSASTSVKIKTRMQIIKSPRDLAGQSIFIPFEDMKGCAMRHVIGTHIKGMFTFRDFFAVKIELYHQLRSLSTSDYKPCKACRRSWTDL